MTMARPLIAGNWKMNLDRAGAESLARELAGSVATASIFEMVVCPPAPYLAIVAAAIGGSPVALGGQDCHADVSGAHTGDVSGVFLKALDCTYVLVGHSERRADHHESDDVVAGKAVAAVRNGLVPIVCVGETAEDLEKFGPSKVPLDQLEVVLDQLKASDEYVVAYEPVWAIGSGQAATPEQAETVARALRGAIEAKHGREAAARTRILYGGSVKSGNIAGFMKRENVDGALVGGASLDVAEFSAIVRFPAHVTLDS
jgi:triosephosphate isomerase